MGRDDVADALHRELSALAGKPLSPRNLQLPAAALLAHFDQFTTGLVPQYGAALRPLPT